MQQLILIANPVAANGRAARTAEFVEQCLKTRKVPYTIKKTEYGGHAVELAREAAELGGARVLALGGDGTVLEVAKGLLHTETPMGIIPAGTGNDFSRSVGVPRGVEEALDYFLQADMRTVDVGIVNDELFMNVSGLGFDVDVAINMNNFKRFFTGLPAYYCAVIQAIFTRKIRPITITTPSGVITRNILLIDVANGKYFGGGMAVAPDADPADGMFDVCIINSISRLRIFFILPRFIKGQHHRIREIEHFSCEEITVDTGDETLRLNLDGEINCQSPAHFKVLPAALRVLA